MKLSKAIAPILSIPSPENVDRLTRAEFQRRYDVIVCDRNLEWFGLKQEEYIQLVPNVDGIIGSQAFPGYWLDKTALLAGNSMEYQSFTSQ
jgi:hypothetical protein